MHPVDLLYSGLMVAAIMLSLWTGALLTATVLFFAPSVFVPAHQKSAPRAATIASTERHVSQAPAHSSSLSQAALARPAAGRIMCSRD